MSNMIFTSKFAQWVPATYKKIPDTTVKFSDKKYSITNVLDDQDLKMTP